MSFASTYNSCSVRGWQSSGGQGYMPINNYTGFGTAASFQLFGNDGANKFIQFDVGESIPGNTAAYTITRNTSNNALTVTSLNYWNNINFAGLTKPCRTDGNLIVTFNSNFDFSPGPGNTILNTGIFAISYYANGTAIYSETGATANTYLGLDAAFNGDGNILAITRGPFGNQGYCEIRSNISNVWSVRDTINTATRLSRIDLSADGNTLIVGCYPDDTCSIYEYDGNTWSNTVLTSSANISNTSFGGAVKLNSYGNIALVLDNYNSGNNVYGRVHVYAKSGNSWNERSIIYPQDYGVGNIIFGRLYGLGLSDDGSTLAINLYDYNNQTNSPLGIQIYQGNLDNYNLQQNISNSGFYFGQYLCISSDGKYIASTTQTGTFAPYNNNFNLYG